MKTNGSKMNPRGNHTSPIDRTSGILYNKKQESMGFRD